jgi:hypothetical protein
VQVKEADAFKFKIGNERLHNSNEGTKGLGSIYDYNNSTSRRAQIHLDIFWQRRTKMKDLT